MQQITVELPDDVKRALDSVSKEEGVQHDEVDGRAVKQHLFLRRFRTLRQRMEAKSETDGPITDEDVFDRVS